MKKGINKSCCNFIERNFIFYFLFVLVFTKYQKDVIFFFLTKLTVVDIETGVITIEAFEAKIWFVRTRDANCGNTSCFTLCIANAFFVSQCHVAKFTSTSYSSTETDLRILIYYLLFFLYIFLDSIFY